MEKAKRKILVIKIGAIGDAAMLLASLVAYKKRYPETYVTWVCGSGISSLIEAFREVDEIIEVDDSRLLVGGILQKMKVVVGLWWRLFGRKVDLCVTAHSDRRYRLLSLVVMAGQKRFWGMHDGYRKPVPGRYHPNEYLSLFTGIEGPYAEHVAFPKLKRDLPQNLKKLFAELTNPVVAIMPGGARNILSDNPQRRWPLSNYVELSERLLEAGITVIVTGGKTDKWVSSCFEGSGVVDLIGKTGLLDLISVYDNCQLVVTHDSGPFHLAKLTGTKILALFGPTSPYEKGPFDPCSKNVKIIWGGGSLACRPCYDGKKFHPCTSNKCMQEITVQIVESEALRLLSCSGD